jgi:hypothetical protein
MGVDASRVSAFAFQFGFMSGRTLFNLAKRYYSTFIYKFSSRSPGRRLVNCPTAQSLERWVKDLETVRILPKRS